MQNDSDTCKSCRAPERSDHHSQLTFTCPAEVNELLTKPLELELQTRATARALNFKASDQTNNYQKTGNSQLEVGLPAPLLPTHTC